MTRSRAANHSVTKLFCEGFVRIPNHRRYGSRQERLGRADRGRNLSRNPTFSIFSLTRACRPAGLLPTPALPALRGLSCLRPEKLGAKGHDIPSVKVLNVSLFRPGICGPPCSSELNKIAPNVIQIKKRLYFSGEQSRVR